MSTSFKVVLFFLLFSVLTSACVKTPTKPQNPLQSIEILSPALAIFSGGSVQLTLLANYPDSVYDVTSDAVWTVSPGTAGTIDENGLFTSQPGESGIETITAKYGDFSETVQIEVTKRATKLSIYPPSPEIKERSSMQFEAIAEFEDASVSYVTDKTNWAVSKTDVGVTIDSTGKLRASSDFLGRILITAKYQSLQAVRRIEIVPKRHALFDMATISFGNFMMGDNQGKADEQPTHKVLVYGFQIGKHEITNRQYALYLNEAIESGDIFDQNGVIIAKTGPFIWRPYALLKGIPELPQVFIEYQEVFTGIFEYRPTPGSSNLPVVKLTWYGAAAFCNYYGYRLPTEAEWEMAARAAQQLEFATADGSISHDLANYVGVEGRDQFPGLAPVGSFPPNPFGVFDMTGNAGEYVFDLYDETYYANSPMQNPKGPGPALFTGDLEGPVVWRGGSWFHEADDCRNSARFSTNSTQNDLNYLIGSHIGFRVAR